MDDQNNDIQKLIRLKRYEQPREGYFDDFLTEFQSRQRSELLKRSAHSLFFERLGTYFSGFTKRQWVYAGSAAYAAVTVGFFLVAGMPGSNVDISAASTVASNASDAGATDETHMWSEKKIILVEDDRISRQIADRRHSMSVDPHSMSVDPEWDLPIQRTSATGNAIDFLPAQDGDDKQSPPPVGISL